MVTGLQLAAFPAGFSAKQGQRGKAGGWSQMQRFQHVAFGTQLWVPVTVITQELPVNVFANTGGPKLMAIMEPNIPVAKRDT